MVHKVRACAVSYAPPYHDHHNDGVNLDPLREMVGKVVDQERPDFICFPEVCACYAKGFEPGIKAAPEIGPFTEVVGKIAKEFDVSLIVPLIERRDGRVYNSVPIVDRKGNHVLTYRKFFPTIGEMDEGITPGWDVPVAECDGVRVGASVCYDANFPQVGEELFRQGCRLMFWPSMFWGGQHLQYWAMRYGFAVVVAYATENAVIDHTGRYLVKQGLWTLQVQQGHLPPWAAADLNTDCEVLHLDGNQKKLDAIRKKYSKDTLIEVYQPEAYFYLSSLTDRVTVEDIIKEFDLDTLRNYLSRAVQKREDALVRAHLPPKEARR
jgi:predicted amidohydrolase